MSSASKKSKKSPKFKGTSKRPSGSAMNKSKFKGNANRSRSRKTLSQNEVMSGKDMS